MNKKLIFFISVLALGLFLSSGTSYADVIYVDDDATGNNDGTSWGDAYTVIQDAVNFAFPGDQIWVAEGIYTRPTGEDIVLSMQDGVEIYGGFAGAESDLSERGATANRPTYLDGEDTSYHVVEGASNARLDGFIVTGGNASGGGGDSYGGGMFNDSVTNLVVTDCTFSGNSANRGGGMCNINSSPTITNCIFSHNSADQRGGAVCNEDSSHDITNSIFWGNTASKGPELSLSYVSIPSTLNINYSDVQGGQALVHIEPGCTLNWGAYMIEDDPLFVTGTNGDYYLSQIATGEPGQLLDSPCVDAGSDTAANLGLDDKTTSTNGDLDTGWVDMGYHYEP
jgi:hypothetical protein